MSQHAPESAARKLLSDLSLFGAAIGGMGGLVYFLGLINFLVYLSLFQSRWLISRIDFVAVATRAAPLVAMVVVVSVFMLIGVLRESESAGAWAIIGATSLALVAIFLVGGSRDSTPESQTVSSMDWIIANLAGICFAWVSGFSLMKLLRLQGEDKLGWTRYRIYLAMCVVVPLVAASAFLGYVAGKRDINPTTSKLPFVELKADSASQRRILAVAGETYYLVSLEKLGVIERVPADTVKSIRTAESGT